MDVTQLYDEIADHYDDDPFDLIAAARACALTQLDAHCATDGVRSILDMGAGTGLLLKALSERMPGAELIAVDVSRRMLEVAAKRVEARMICDDACNIASHLSDPIDVAALHFILAYVVPERVLGAVANVLAPGGVCSVATSTFRSFPLVQRVADQFLGAGTARSGPSMPEDPDHVARLLEGAGLSVVTLEELEITVRFENFNHFHDFGLKGGWFSSYLVGLTPEQAEPIAAAPGLFPADDTSRHTVALARKA